MEEKKYKIVLRLDLVNSEKEKKNYQEFFLRFV